LKHRLPCWYLIFIINVNECSKAYLNLYNNILTKITQTAELSKEVNVIEIGPGIGSLTYAPAYLSFLFERFFGGITIFLLLTSTYYLYWGQGQISFSRAFFLTDVD